jgi:phosphate transport system substrate-binding protein
MHKRAIIVGVAFMTIAAGCNTAGRVGEGDGSGLAGTIQIDGSSTVAPISQTVTEAFNAEEPGVNVAVGTSGTGGGFEKFCNGDIDIADASRPIEDDEKAACAKNSVEFVELTIAIDGLTVVVNKDNDFVECLTIDDLKKIWEPDSKVTTWKDVDDSWPADEIQLYGPGADSGTFDYFTDVIVGEEGASRKDYTQSENDNQLVRGVSGEENALGYFGYAYYIESTDELKAVQIDGGAGCVSPTETTIEDGTYAPLARPLFIYPSTTALGEEHVQAFVEFYLDNVSEIVGEVGYVPAPADDIEAAKSAVSEAIG